MHDPAEQGQDDGPHTFTFPLPPPPFPHPAGEEPPDVVYVVGPPPPASPGLRRDQEDLLLRRVPADIARKFRTAAGGRALTHGQYLSALVGLHEAMRALADDGDERVAAALAELRLTTVTV